MTFQEAITNFQSLIPAAIGGTICLLALLGIGELLKETSTAFKKRSQNLKHTKKLASTSQASNTHHGRQDSIQVNSSKL